MEREKGERHGYCFLICLSFNRKRFSYLTPCHVGRMSETFSNISFLFTVAVKIPSNMFFSDFKCYTDASPHFIALENVNRRYCHRAVTIYSWRAFSVLLYHAVKCTVRAERCMQQSKFSFTSSSYVQLKGYLGKQ